MKKHTVFLMMLVIITSLLIGCTPAKETPVIIVVQDPTRTPTPTVPPPASETQDVPTPSLTPPPTEVVFLDRSQEKIPVIYTHGGGPCDIGGTVFLKKHPNVDLIGVVLSRGEIHPEIARDKWAAFLYDVLDLQGTALGLGTDERLDPNSHEFPEGWRSLADNFWNLGIPDPVMDYETQPGPQLIVDLVNRSPQKVTLIAMASLADIALAMQQDPGIIDNIANVVIMGGAFTVPGNLSDAPYEIDNQVAEWNMWIDAQAAKYVINSGVPISIVPLDAIQYLVDAADVAIINGISDPGVNYVARMWNTQIGWNGPFLIWDTITSTAITNPENFYWTYDGVDVITEPGDHQGQTVPLNNGATHIRYATGADYQAILDQLFETYRGETVSWITSEGEPDEGPQDGSLADLAGTWEGSTTGNFQITFYLGSDCELNKPCGTFEIPDFSLTGDITFVNITGNIFEFKASNFSLDSVSPAVYEYLELLDDGTLKYVTQGEEGGNEGILYRK